MNDYKPTYEQTQYKFDLLITKKSVACPTCNILIRTDEPYITTFCHKCNANFNILHLSGGKMVGYKSEVEY